MRRQILIAGWLLTCSILGTACSGSEYETLRGATMGTYYAISHRAAAPCEIAQAEVDARLVELNASMSTYQADSELSRFNASTSLDWQAVSPELATVLAAAMDVWRASDGAFDVTVGPLVNLWGFGPPRAEEPRSEPSPGAQAEALADTGMRHLAFEDGRLRKARAGVYVDLSALAKGYAVDVIADLLANRQCRDFLVDIGGEVRGHGVNPRGEAWRIGVEVPDPARLGAVQRVLELRDASIATSGDYRNYRVIDGARVDHVIDPRSGRPADNRVASATVIHPSAMLADAYATTLMVLGEREGLAFAEARDLPALLLVQADGEFSERYTSALKAHLADPR